AEWALVAGGANVLDDEEQTGLAGLEARWDPFRLPFGRRHLPVIPALGLTANGDGGTYGYLSFRVDVLAAAAGLGGGAAPRPATERPWLVTVYTGLGHYRPGDDGRELGGPLEFRSGLELSRRLGARTRLGLSFDHLSNAGVYERNPGTESLVLTWSWRPGG
ncbi:MAG TPA: acyloxyacyl hydrolase, partial [Thermoanaerobaculia bacterium]